VPHYSVAALRRLCIASATRPFLARGSTLERCEHCQLGIRWCICDYRDAVAQRRLSTRADFLLLMHRHETMKPTNTGRLIGDVLPEATHAYLWHRTEPDALLLQFLEQRAGKLWILFPASYCEPSVHDVAPRRPRIIEAVENIAARNERPTFILLDGTWKQARKMFHMSEWLQHIPLVQLHIGGDGNYRLRQGAHASQVSTLEAAAALLEALGDAGPAAVMRDYFDTFNEYYAASRESRAPQQHAAMTRLLAPAR
jgi:DTW domain-containing protein YfiP